MTDEAARTVLLIEGETSLRRLIALGLQQRAMHVLEASSSSLPATLAAQESAHPDLLIVDIDRGSHSNGSLVRTLRSTPQISDVPIIVLSWEAGSRTLQAACEPDEQVHYLAKPFDARVLYALIEETLASRQQRAAPGPDTSLCPLITAAGLLLVIIGLMTQLALTAVGLLVVLITLLCWTLGRAPGKGLALPRLQPSQPCHV
jgi:DNA-binding response OmpR family regulator